MKQATENFEKHAEKMRKTHTADQVKELLGSPHHHAFNAAAARWIQKCQNQNFTKVVKEKIAEMVKEKYIMGKSKSTCHT
eukprot:6595529-Karenia_brevis.AAC.1